MATLIQTTIAGGDGVGGSNANDNWLHLTDHSSNPASTDNKLYANSSGLWYEGTRLDIKIYDVSGTQVNS